ncbi:hypothetical protein CLV98_101673 [Dyadobacter jejuensis]|uniref:DUF3649 domain-containing protein n=1 Tax=Dyadobacter jejuensis TaxID=1082580 RepID=A0A316AT60_9BACT|nr:hypothetical protein [Dyadobacter jejuensis]PWJ60489.1 hypothetical protein CLV98_101673 [Dyadobacter jejuensis]
MPANKKHLTKSPWLRLSKILAGTVGGYAVMMSLHLFLTAFLPKENVIITAFFTGYILWAFLLLYAFVASNVWRVWAIYIACTLLFSLPYLLKINLNHGY